MQSFLNELSLPKHHSQTEAIKSFKQFGECFKRLSLVGIKEVKIHSSFYAHEFAPGYSFFNVIGDDRLDADLRTLLKSVVGIVPYVDELLKQYEAENRTALEMKIEDDVCLGLGLASEAIFNTVSLSYLPNNWDSPIYVITVNNISEGDGGNLTVEHDDSNARNVATVEHAEQHSHFISEQIASTIESGRELWLRRSELFPNLDFCEQVKGQLAGYHYNTLGFQQIILRLLDLQQVALRFGGKPIKPEDFPTRVSPESDTRLRLFENELTVLCPDGHYRLFSWHSRFTPGAGRIHFIPFEDRKIILVGSVANQNTIK